MNESLKIGERRKMLLKIEILNANDFKTNSVYHQNKNSTHKHSCGFLQVLFGHRDK